MDERLLKFPDSLKSKDNGESFKLLEELTTFHSLELLRLYPVNKLKYLSFWNADTISNREIQEHIQVPGFRVDADGEWMLVMGAESTLIEEMIRHCGSELTYLNISIQDGPDILDLTELTALRNLNVNIGSRNTRLIGVEQLCFLEHLSLRTGNSGDELDVSALTHLHHLFLVDNQLRNVRGLQALQQLKKLYISCENLQGTLCLDGLSALSDLCLLFSGINAIVINHPLPDVSTVWILGTQITDTSFIQCMPSTESFMLMDSPVCSLPNLECLHCLEDLSLYNTKIESMDDVGLPASLQSLDIDKTPIRRIPEQIRTLKKLKQLSLSHLELDELPDWLPELGLEFRTENVQEGIILKDTHVQNVDMSIFDQSQEMILQWFAQRRMTPMPLNELKVVFLGDGEAGKTHTIARLLRDGERPEDLNNSATPGIDIRNKEYALENGRRIRVHFWDFGGQEIMHSMHRLFLTGRTLYVVLINARDDTQDDRARYWLHNIKNFADGSPVLLVLNKIDQNPNASVNERGLRELYPGLAEVIRMSALVDSPEAFRENFTAALLRQIRDFPYLESPFLSSWNKLKSNLEQMQRSYIHGSDYELLCGQCGVEESPATRKALLEWFNDLGVSFYYGDRDSISLEDYVILRPDWITNAIYIILFNRSDAADNGIISLTAIQNMLSPPEEDRKRFRRVVEDAEYSPEDTRYVMNVLERFRLCYRMNDEHVFIPMLCQRNSLPVTEEYAQDSRTLEFWLEYEYLPNNVLHRLMVERRRELDMDHVWLTGARFVLGDTGLSAVVKCEDRLVRLYVRAEDDRYSPAVYLSTLIDHITCIQESLHIAQPQKLIVYKNEDWSENFDYDMLIGNLSCGIDACYSRRKRGLVPIQQILGDFGFRGDSTKEHMLRKLLKASPEIAKGSAAMQQREDMRVRQLSKLLSTELLIEDQLMSGISKFRPLAGELDLKFMHGEHFDYSGCDILNLGDRYQPDLLRKHVMWLLRYNHSDRQMAPFLLCCIDGSEEQFELLYRKYADVMRKFGNENSPFVIEDPILGGIETAPDRIRMAQCLLPSEQKQELWLIFVRFGD